MEIQIYPPGNEFGPLIDYINSLAIKEQEIIFNKIELYKKYSLQCFMVSADTTNFQGHKKLYEITIGNHRITYTIIGGVCWLLHGFRKKGQKTPINEIEYANKLKNDLIDKLNKQ